MTQISEIKVGSRVSANGGKLAVVVAIKGRWVKVRFDHDNSEKNVGFKDITLVADKAPAKNGIVNPARRAAYTVTKLDGLVAVDNGDEVASALRGMELDDVVAIAAQVLGVTAKSLREKYSHLNNGQIRMNIGNRIRKAIRNDASLAKMLK